MVEVTRDRDFLRKRTGLKKGRRGVHIRYRELERSSSNSQPSQSYLFADNLIWPIPPSSLPPFLLSNDPYETPCVD